MAAYTLPTSVEEATQQTSGGGTGGSTYVQTNLELKRLFEARENKLPLVNPIVAAINQLTVRAVKNQITKANEFYYENGKMVKGGRDYHIHYTSDLGEYFMTGPEHNPLSKLIFPLAYDISQFNYYNTLNQQSPLKLISNTTIPTEEDYKKGSYKRYFAKQANDKNQPTFEVSKQDFQSSPLYNYVSLRWYIAGNKNYVYAQNLREIRIASNGINRILTPFQFYRFEENLSDADLLRRRLANMMDLSGYNTVTQSDVNATSSGDDDAGAIRLDEDGNYIGNAENDGGDDPPHRIC